MRFRIDGLLRRVAGFPSAVAANIVSRLKVQAELLTYQTDSPQEGRIRIADRDVEMRLSTFPTLHGERAVVRIFGPDGRYEQLDDLGLHHDLLGPLRQLLVETSGAVLVSGPAGSGKTTTIFAKRRAARQGALLWVLTAAAERSIPLVAAVEAFSRQGRGRFAWRARRLAGLLADGVTLPEALGRLGNLVPADALPMIHVGHQSGALAGALRQAADHRFEKPDETSGNPGEPSAEDSHE